MATKEDCCLPAGSKQSAQINSASNSDAQYNNLNLNQSYNASSNVINPVQSKNISNKNDERIGNVFNEISDHPSVNLSKQNFSKNAFNNKDLKSFQFTNLSEGEAQKQLKESEKFSTKNSSTLSLHISAYENSIEVGNSDGQNESLESMKEKPKMSTFKKIKNSVKQFFENSSTNPSFEIPRQQEDETTEPEIMQFKASQKLLNPNVGIDGGGNAAMTEKDSNTTTEAVKDETESAGLLQENDERKAEMEVLMKDLETKTENFMEIIELNSLRKMSLKHNNGFKKFEDFFGSIDNVIKWYETEIARYRSYANILLNGIFQHDQSSSTLSKEYQEKIKIMEEKLEQMKTVEVEMKAKIQSMQEKEQESNEKLAEMEAEVDAANSEIARLESTLSPINDIIKCLKEMLAETVTSFEAKNAELEQTNAHLQAQLERKTAENNTQKHETSKIISDLQKQLFDTTLSSNEKTKALENEIAELKKAADNFIELKDVVVNGNINYQLLNGKVLVVNKLKPGSRSDDWKAFYNDGNEEIMVDLELNDSFKLHLNGSLFARPPGWGSDVNDLYPHLHSCELTKLSLTGHIETYDQFLKLVESRTIEILDFEVVSVYDENGKYLPLEKMLTFFPNLKNLSFLCRNTFTSCSTCRIETASNLLKLEPFKNLQKFSLYACPYGFDLEKFGNFMKKNDWAEFKVAIIENSQNVGRLRFQFSQDVTDKMHADRKAIFRCWPKTSPRPDISFTFPSL